MPETLPTVRLVVLNFNGGELVLRSVEHLLALDWPPDRLEVVVVDNASTDGSDVLIEHRFPGIRLIRSEENLGFPANNLALRDLDGVDYVGLINNDAFAEPGYLRPLVAALQADPGLGAVCPRILLAPRFSDLRIRSAGWDADDGRLLGVRLSGVRVGGVDVDRSFVPADGVDGPAPGGADEPWYRWTEPDALLRVPVMDGPTSPEVASQAEVRLAAVRPTEVELDGGGEKTTVEVGTEPAWHAVALAGEPYDVVNNVGSELVEGGWGRDRGFLEPDTGQFDEPTDVFAWCGAGVLFPVGYLRDVGLFDERFFMYYEDTDLSWRGRARGWRYRYIPDAVLRHVHAATSVEGSAMFNHFVERNRLLMLAKNAPVEYSAQAVWRFLLSTASYARRDIVRPVLRGHRPNTGLVRARLRSFGGFLRFVPSLREEQHRRQTESKVHDEAILGWSVPR